MWNLATGPPLLKRLVSCYQVGRITGTELNSTIENTMGILKNGGPIRGGRVSKVVASGSSTVYYKTTQKRELVFRLCCHSQT